MNSAELVRRRQRLQYRSAQQRMLIANDVRPLLPFFSKLDSIRNGLRWLRGNPVLGGAALALLGLARPRVAFRWAKRGLFFWQAWRRVRRLLQK